MPRPMTKPIPRTKSSFHMANLYIISKPTLYFLLCNIQIHFGVSPVFNADADTDLRTLFDLD